MTKGSNTSAPSEPIEVHAKIVMDETASKPTAPVHDGRALVADLTKSLAWPILAVIFSSHFATRSGELLQLFQQNLSKRPKAILDLSRGRLSKAFAKPEEVTLQRASVDYLGRAFRR